MRQRRAIYFLVVLSLIGLTALAGVPRLVNFQGQLKNNTGSPLVNDTLAVEFKIYDAAVSGSAKWSEIDTVITDVGGLFTILLGKKTPIPDSVFNDSLRWLGIKVGSDAEISPRSQLSAVGYSYVSSQWTSAAQNLFRLNGNVGIGISSPDAKLDVLNTGSDPFSITGIRGQVENASSGAAYGGYFAISTAGTGSHYGVYGTAGNSSTGASYGGYFLGSSTGGTSYGVYASGGTYGLYGTSNYIGAACLGDGSTNLFTIKGCDGYANNSYSGGGATAVGGNFEAYSPGSPYGVVGYASGSSTGNAYGGNFTAFSSSGSATGVYGNGATYGVHGNSNNNIGVYGTSGTYDGGYFSGGYAGAIGSGGTYGVYGQASNNGGYGVFGSDGFNPLVYAGYFQGDVRVSGDFDVVFGTKSAAVKIDNGEYRRLYAQESPENWFEDFGTAQLVNGQATVKIDPLYAQTVNTAVTYHVFLTPEGDCRGLYVASKTPASFEIRELQNGKSDLSVSYRIVAKRKGYENIRLAKLPGQTPEEVQAEQLKMAAERKQQEEQRIKMEQSLEQTGTKPHSSDKPTPKN